MADSKKAWSDKPIEPESSQSENDPTSDNGLEIIDRNLIDQNITQVRPDPAAVMVQDIELFDRRRLSNDLPT